MVPHFFIVIIGFQSKCVFKLHKSEDSTKLVSSCEKQSKFEYMEIS